MGDLLYFAKSIQEAESLKQHLISILQTGDFKLAKWQSNVKKLCEKNSDANIVSVLGL